MRSETRLITRRTDPVVRAVGLSQTLGKRKILNGIDLEVQAGEIVSVMGASGSGKSTLLYALAGLREPSSGRVAWYGTEDIWELGEPSLTRERRNLCGFVFQFPAFLDDLTARENVGLPLVIAGQKPTEAWVRGSELLSQLGLGQVADNFPATLSGGELQRASIARALVLNPLVVFADEPTGALDEDNSALVMSTFASVAREFNVAVVVVTHDPDVARTTDRTLRLRQGTLTAETSSTSAGI